jgi:hypothetical protein
MDSIKKIFIGAVYILTMSPTVFSQNELKFGEKKIKIPGSEICSYTVNKNSHIDKDYLEIKNGRLLYTVVEYDQGVPVHIEMTECNIADLDKSSCSVGSSDQKLTYTPGAIYVIYLYTSKDQAIISTTVYDSPNGPASIQNSSVGRLHFKDYQVAQTCFDNNFK